MLVGDTNQLDYSKTYDKATPQEKQRLALQLAASTGGSSGQPILAGSAAGNALSSLGLASGSQLAAHSDNKSEEPFYYEEALESRP